MHIAGRKNVYEKPNESDKTSVNTAQTVHSETEIGTESTNLYPRPEVIENGFVDKQRTAARDKRDVKRNDRRHEDRPASNKPAEHLVLQLPANEPVDYGTDQRGENYDTK